MGTETRTVSSWALTTAVSCYNKSDTLIYPYKPLGVRARIQPQRQLFPFDS
jgi:hypothetical protein